MSLRILIADDHEIIRYALRTLFEAEPDSDIQVVAEAENGREAVALARQHKPDIVIMDLTMPELNGIEATRQIRQICPNAKVIVLSMHNRRQYLRELIKVGISGYVVKTRVSNDLIEAINAAGRGQVYFSPKVAAMMADDYVGIISGQETIDGKTLSPRQKEVLQMVVEGKGTKEIAAILSVTPKAIESVRHRIMLKLGIDNLADLTKYALQEGLTTLDY